MSGIEVAGLILGALPILIDGLGNYRKSFRLLRTGFEKRREVDKLTHVVRQQAGIFRELLKSILLKSGCDIPPTFPADMEDVLKDSQTKDSITEFLGEDYETFMYHLRECDESFRQLIFRIAKLVPSVKVPPHSLLASSIMLIFCQDSANISKILEANKDTKKLELGSRISLVIHKKDFDEECQRLESSLHSLHRLHDLISSNHELAGDRPSGKAKSLARAFMKLRAHAENLYLAVSKSWVVHCHQKHEAKLFLEDRLEESKQAWGKKRRADLPMHVFRFVFAGHHPPVNGMWHESIVQVFPPTDQDMVDPHPSANNQTTRQRVTIIAPPSKSPARPMKEIKDICSAIEAGKANQEHTTFALTLDCKIAIDCGRKDGFKSPQVKETVLLKDMLMGASQTPQGRPVISWSQKLQLALNIASSFLQLLRTPWTGPRLSIDQVAFLQLSNQSADLSKPFLSLSFDSVQTGQQATLDDFQLKDALAELGIMLLEIWHEETLEHKFSLNPGAMGPNRRFHALEWLEAEPRVWSNLYHKAAYHCIVGAMNISPYPKDWDDMRLWETVCESVIEPLSKLSRI